MRRIEKIQKEIEVEICECDICGKDSKNMYGVGKKCAMCGRDICPSCATSDNHDESDDYPPWYCESCWTNGLVGYYDEKQTADDEHDERCQKIYDKWEKVALKAIEKK